MTTSWRIVLGVALPVAACGSWVEPQPQVWRLTLSPPSALIFAGDSLQLAATALDSFGQAISGQIVSYRSDQPDVATVSEAGTVKGWSRGTAYLEASSGGVMATALVGVKLGGIVGPTGGTITIPGGGVALTLPARAIATRTAIDLDSAALDPGDSAPLRGTMFSIGPSTLALSKPAVLTIHYDRVGLSPGEERSVGLYADTASSWMAEQGSIANLANQSVSAPITGPGQYAILAPGPVASIAIDPKSVMVVYGTTLRLSCNLKDSAGKTLDNRPIAWASMDTTVVQVSQLGWVTPITLGVTSVTASSGGLSDTAIVISAFSCACLSPAAGASVSAGACSCAGAAGGP